MSMHLRMTAVLIALVVLPCTGCSAVLSGAFWKHDPAVKEVTDAYSYGQSILIEYSVMEGDGDVMLRVADRYWAAYNTAWTYGEGKPESKPLAIYRNPMPARLRKQLTPIEICRVDEHVDVKSHKDVQAFAEKDVAASTPRVYTGAGSAYWVFIRYLKPGSDVPNVTELLLQKEFLTDGGKFIRNMFMPVAVAIDLAAVLAIEAALEHDDEDDADPFRDFHKSH